MDEATKSKLMIKSVQGIIEFYDYLLEEPGDGENNNWLDHWRTKKETAEFILQCLLDIENG